MFSLSSRSSRWRKKDAEYQIVTVSRGVDMALSYPPAHLPFLPYEISI